MNSYIVANVSIPYPVGSCAPFNTLSNIIVFYEDLFEEMQSDAPLPLITAFESCGTAWKKLAEDLTGSRLSGAEARNLLTLIGYFLETVAGTLDTTEELFFRRLLTSLSNQR